MKQMVIDMHEVETFMVGGEYIKKAIQARVRDELRGQLQAYMTEVQNEIDEAVDPEGVGIKRTPEERAGLVLAVFRTSNESPPVLLLRQCLDRAKGIQDEIEDLEHIYQNINPDPAVLYRLNLKQLKQYGLKLKVTNE